MIRSPDDVLALVMVMNPEKMYCFQPSSTTHCNDYAVACCAGLRVPLPAGTLANDLYAWLKGKEASQAGWNQCDRVTALRRANLGYPTLAAAQEQPHGHIALVVPSPSNDLLKLYVSAAGARCFLRAPLANSFGALQPDFFTIQ